jgi:hypothetical protein
VQESLIFQKTELGRYELATRKLGLSNTLRLVLVLVDGRRSVRTLAAFSDTVAQDPQCLEELLKQGMIEVVSDGTSPPAPASAPPRSMALAREPEASSAPQLPASSPGVDSIGAQVNASASLPDAPRLPMAKQLLVSELRAVLGEEADVACSRVQQINNLEEMLVALPRLTGLIALYSTKTRGDQAHDRIRDLLL